MKRTIENKVIISFDHRPLKIPVYDEDGEVVKDKDGKNTTEIGTLATCLRRMIRFFPLREVTPSGGVIMSNLATTDNMIKANRLYEKLEDVKKVGDSIHMKDGLLNWTTSMVRNEKVGVAMFGLNIKGILEALGSDIEPDKEDEKSDEDSKEVPTPTKEVKKK